MTALPKRPLILLAEDDVALRQMISTRLRTEGLDVVDVNDGFELKGYLDHCGEGRPFPAPDLVLSDVRMPGPCELDALPRKVPVVLMTSLIDDSVRKDAERLGATNVFQKPFRLGELVLSIRCAVRSY